MEHSIAVVVPCYKSKAHVLGVLARMGPEVCKIYVVDDGCPEGTGQYVKEMTVDDRIQVLWHESNQGVGSAVMTGYESAIKNGADIIVKVDSDGQMDPELLPHIIAPVVYGKADYAKGNRFYNLERLYKMPTVRIFGNAVLSLMAKLSTGYWDMFDPTNGYTAVRAAVAKDLPFSKISQGYFFETDILFRLNTLGAVVVDVPMDAQYGDEESQLKITRIVGEFLFKHLRNFCKRIFYNYYLRNVSLASLELPLGMLLLLFGMGFGSYHWWLSAREGLPTLAGTVMLAGLPILMGIQFILAFLNYDIASVPKRPRYFSDSTRPMG